MKKKIVAILTVSAIASIFGGLVYCGISAFPELLQPEQEKAHIEEAHFEAPIVSNQFETFVSNDNAENKIVVNGLLGNYKDMVIIYEEFADETTSYVEQSLVAFETVEDKQEAVVEEVEAKEEAEEVRVYMSIDTEKSAHVNKVHKRKTFTFKPVSISTRGVLESTLLVTVVVEALSLFSRQKNRFQKLLHFPQYI